LAAVTLNQSTATHLIFQDREGLLARRRQGCLEGLGRYHLLSF